MSKCKAQDSFAVPNPGSMEAFVQGCCCPVIDNEFGRGYHWRPDHAEPRFVKTANCPLHGGDTE